MFDIDDLMDTVLAIVMAAVSIGAALVPMVASGLI